MRATVTTRSMVRVSAHIGTPSRCATVIGQSRAHSTGVIHGPASIRITCSRGLGRRMPPIVIAKVERVHRARIALRIIYTQKQVCAILMGLNAADSAERRNSGRVKSA